MYSSSSSTSSPNRAGPPPLAGLTRYGSAPGSLLSNIADSVLMDPDFRSHIGSGPDTRIPPPPPPLLPPMPRQQHQIVDPKLGGSMLTRHSSSPAGFFSHLLVDNGFTRGIGHYSQPSSNINGGHAMPGTTGIKTQMSFSRQDPLSQISELDTSDMRDGVADETTGNVGQSYISANYHIGSWDDTNSIAFSAPSTKRANIDSQFSLPTSLEMASVDNFFQGQQDSVGFKVRAKRGCATHPRSIAERERRTRISEKLRKLQELVPNMDKQTSTSDMLDLAVEHIKKLQSQVRNLNKERANCTCACKDECP